MISLYKSNLIGQGIFFLFRHADFHFGLGMARFGGKKKEIQSATTVHTGMCDRTQESCGRSLTFLSKVRCS